MAAWNDENLTRSGIRGKKRDAVIRQAALEFRKRGYHATTMDDIAAALGVTKGALYRYVKSKDEVLFECFNQSYNIGVFALKQATAVEGTAAQKVQAFIRIFIAEYLDANLAGGAMIEIDALLPEQRRQVVKGRDKLDAQLRHLIVAGIEDGSIADESPKLTIFTFMGAVNWIPSWYAPDGPLTSAEIADNIARILMNGVRSRAEPPVAG